MIVHETPLRRLVAAILERCGSASAEARLVADHLVEANLMGHDSHGVGLLPTYVRHAGQGYVSPNTSAECVQDDGAVLVFDGRQGYGRRVAGEAMAAAIDRCRQTGVVALALRNAHHIGRVGAYGEMSIDAALISLHFVNVVDHAPSVAPFAGADPRYTTNPVCIAVPGSATTEPVLLDMATSGVASGKVRVAFNKGERLKDGLLIDADGRPTNDPAVRMRDPRGALLPFGAHKGSGLALICELLAGGLSGGGTIQPGNPRRGGIINNMFAVVIDPARFSDPDWLRAEIDATVAYVKASPPAEAGTPVMVAGEPERAARLVRARDGLPIDDTTWDGILEAAESVRIPRAEAEALAGGG